MKMNEFVFTDDMIRRALKANNWVTWYNEDNWVELSNRCPDRTGINTQSAFKMLLNQKNLF
jgi:hypothetical protein